MDLQEYCNLLSAISSVFTVVAIIIGGFWVFYLFVVRREAASDPDIDLSFSELPFDNESRLLVATIKVSNDGSRMMYPINNGTGVVFSLKQLPTKLDALTSLHFTDGQYILQNVDVIEKANPDYDMKGARYRLPPKAAFSEVLAVVVPKDALLVAKGELRTTDDQQVWIYKFWRVSGSPVAAVMSQTPMIGNQSTHSTGGVDCQTT